MLVNSAPGKFLISYSPMSHKVLIISNRFGFRKHKYFVYLHTGLSKDYEHAPIDHVPIPIYGRYYHSETRFDK